MKKILLILIILLFSKFNIVSQNQIKRVLFIGNSYTYVNNLPQMTADIARSMGDSIFFDSSAPGGYTFQQHSTNAVTLEKIMNSNWDFVVLQEQSQFPSFPISQVEADVFPYARILDSLINAYNPCAETVFYMTWGRKNGDASNCASWPPVCTYDGMDSLLNLRYRMMAESNHAILSPVGAVWNYIRQNYPSIELYSSDESHPSIAGTFAAACSFYAALFRKNPELIPFDSGLPSLNAENIRHAVKTVVFDSLTNWHIGEYDPIANFSFVSNQGNSIECTNLSINANEFWWDFGDGNTSQEENPTHYYTSADSYKILLTASHCGLSDTISRWFVVETININEIENQDNLWDISPNPAQNIITLNIGFKTIIEYKIFNSCGIEITNGKIENSSKTIDISYLTEGLYFIQLFENKNKIGVRKFIKQE